LKKPSRQDTVTDLLRQWRSGNSHALDDLMPHVYDELRRLARRAMQSEREGHTLQHTALVHEAYLQLVHMDVSWNDKAHFFAVAARAMRRILVDHARGKHREKRGGDAVKVSLDEAPEIPAKAAVGILDLDGAFQRLAALDTRKAEALELHYFGGLTLEEIAEVMGVSPTTVKRELRMAKAWLNQELRAGR
jgi:RNA polymerase sigma factor (TIGR02999 family)